MTGKRILLLGSSGKCGTAIRNVFGDSYAIVGKNSMHFDAGNLPQVRALLRECACDIVVNAAAFVGIDACEREPERAYAVNTLFPKLLAELSVEMGFLLVHFSTDAVFADRTSGYYVESDSPRPCNIYGFTKFGADCFVQAIARRYYLVRIALQFGETGKGNQFVEKMLQRVRDGQKVLNISADIVSSPSYSKDVARRLRGLIEEESPFGLYHLVNEGQASLFDLMREVARALSLPVEVRKASHTDFPSLGIKNTCTPVRSEKVGALRPWRDAVAEYCRGLR